MHLDLICLLFLSDCSLIIAMLKQLAGSPKIYSSRWGWGGKDEEVENGQPGGFRAAAKEGYRAARAGGWHCSGPFILMALPSWRWDDSLKVTSWQSSYSLMKNCPTIFTKIWWTNVRSIMLVRICWQEDTNSTLSKIQTMKLNTWSLSLLSFLFVAALMRWNSETLSSYQTWRLFVNALRMFHGLSPRTVKDRDFDSSDKWQE